MTLSIIFVLYFCVNFYMMGALDGQAKEADTEFVSITQRLLIVFFGTLLMIVAVADILNDKRKAKKKSQ